MKLSRYLIQKGQTSVEYLLMLAMAVSLGLLVFKNFQKFLLTNPDSYINNQMNYYKGLFDPEQGYKRFRLPR